MPKKTSTLARDPLTDEELWFISADDFLRLDLSDEEKARLKTINRQKEQERAERSARLAEEATPMLAHLREVGCAVGSVWDLVNTRDPYPNAIPVLLEHLQLQYSDRTREGIARALAVRDLQIQEAWSILVEQCRREPWGEGKIAPGDTRDYRLGAKDGLACALSATVIDENMNELITLILDPSNGPSRLLLLQALRRRRSKSPTATSVIERLSNDPLFSKEIASWRTR